MFYSERTSIVHFPVKLLVVKLGAVITTHLMFTKVVTEFIVEASKWRLLMSVACLYMWRPLQSAEGIKCFVMFALQMLHVSVGMRVLSQTHLIITFSLFTHKMS